MGSPRPTDTPLIKGGRGDRVVMIIASLIVTSYLKRKLASPDLNRDFGRNRAFLKLISKLSD